ncbi:hypothetical protein ACGRHY_00240 [Streptomyces sp. HK10]
MLSQRPDEPALMPEVAEPDHFGGAMQDMTDDEYSVAPAAGDR